MNISFCHHTTPTMKEAYLPFHNTHTPHCSLPKQQPTTLDSKKNIRKYIKKNIKIASKCKVFFDRKMKYVVMDIEVCV